MLRYEQFNVVLFMFFSSSKCKKNQDLLSFFQVHMEQGPVLEALRYPLGVVKGIAGQTRLKVHYNYTILRIRKY
jgi:hypothetical protein